jgi:hypothetical protein
MRTAGQPHAERCGAPTSRHLLDGEEHFGPVFPTSGLPTIHPSITAGVRTVASRAFL